MHRTAAASVLIVLLLPSLAALALCDPANPPKTVLATPSSFLPAPSGSRFGNYSVYFGNLHSHSELSNTVVYTEAQGTAEEAYAYARDTAGLDFFALTDHAEALSESDWGTLKAAADAYDAPGSFAALWGFEWSSVAHGHACVWGTDDHCTLLGPSDPEGLYAWVAARPGALMGFNHPGRKSTESMFNSLTYSDTAADQVVSIEVRSKGDDSGEKGSYFEKYLMALDKGWRVGPRMAQDNHDADWGTLNDDRTAVWATALTRGAIAEALAARRFYATMDKNLVLNLRCGNVLMGGTVGNGDLVFRVELDDPDGEGFSWIELFRDTEVIENRSVSGASVSETFVVRGVEGDHFFLIRVRQVDGQWATSAPIWSDPTANSPPVAMAGPDVTASPGRPVSFDGSGSHDPDGSNLTYMWDFDASNGLGVDAVGMVVSHTYTVEGVYTVTLTVEDENGSIAEDTLTVYVYNRPPTAVITFTPSNPETGQVVQFDGRGSSDPDGTLTTYAWDFDASNGLSTDATGPTASHAYADPGQYEVTLSVQDNHGVWASTSVYLTVTQHINQPPTAVAPMDITVTTLVEVPFDGSGSYDPEDDLLTYAWDFDASNGVGTDATGPLVHHTYLRAGVYVVTLRVSDGQSQSEDIMNVTVRNRSPSVSIPERAESIEDQALTLIARADDPDGTISRIDWTFGDGSSSEGATASHAWNRSGTYVVGVTAWDDLGSNASEVMTVSVANVPPTASISGPSEAQIGELVTFRAEVNDTPSDLPRLNLTWETPFGLFSGREITVTPAGPGDLAIVLTVTDDDGAKAAVTAVLSVPFVNRPPVIDSAYPAGTEVRLTKGGTQNFTCTFHDPDEGAGQSPEADWLVDGTRVQGGRAFAFAPRSAGTYTVTLRIFDGLAMAYRNWTVEVADTGNGTGKETGGSETGAETDDGTADEGKGAVASAKGDWALPILVAASAMVMIGVALAVLVARRWRSPREDEEDEARDEGGSGRWAGEAGAARYIEREAPRGSARGATAPEAPLQATLPKKGGKGPSPEKDRRTVTDTGEPSLAPDEEFIWNDAELPPPPEDERPAPACPEG